MDLSPETQRLVVYRDDLAALYREVYATRQALVEENQAAQPEEVGNHHDDDGSDISRGGLSGNDGGNSVMGHLYRSGLETHHKDVHARIDVLRQSVASYIKCVGDADDKGVAAEAFATALADLLLQLLLARQMRAKLAQYARTSAGLGPSNLVVLHVERKLLVEGRKFNRALHVCLDRIKDAVSLDRLLVDPMQSIDLALEEVRSVCSVAGGWDKCVAEEHEALQRVPEFATWIPDAVRERLDQISLTETD